jgi:hypothetical protein
MPERWQRIEAVLEDAEVTPRETAGTLWGLYNAVTGDEDHRTTREAFEDRRFERIWFGTGADLKIRTLNFCRNFLKEAA